LGSSTLSCSRNTLLTTKITNYGSNEQDETALNIYNSALGINFNYVDIDLDNDLTDSDSSYSKTVSISLSDSVKAGTYDLQVTAYIEEDEKIDSKFVSLTIADCKTNSGSSSSSSNGSSNVVVVTTKPNTTTTTSTSGSGVVQTVETSFSQIKGIVIFMGVVAGLLVILIILVIVALATKKK
jgi:hypothetical protein